MCKAAYLRSAFADTIVALATYVEPCINSLGCFSPQAFSCRSWRQRALHLVGEEIAGAIMGPTGEDGIMEAAGTVGVTAA